MKDESRPLATSLEALNAEIVSCRRCPRLVAWREKVAAERTRRFRDWTYWGKPVPGFGDPDARVWIVGLAPAAHGANRTGRMFTGDRSGDWLYRALHRAGFANQPKSYSRDDGLRLTDCYISALLRCCPPQNKPLKSELQNCRPFLVAEFELLSRMRVIVSLGQLAYQQMLQILSHKGFTIPRPRPAFAHLQEIHFHQNLTLLASYHPSQQNTFTGKLTEAMFDAVWQRVKKLVS
ncbi:MAG: uracil-DNA glycosylase [Calditrichaeota bacterium]|nr:MAG: uracil-DNA glycosylase [Calditrichota bacterium]